MTELSTRKAVFGKEPPDKTDSSEFRRSLAIVIGIDKYSNGIPPLATAVNDARELARILEDKHKYEVILLTDEEATLLRLKKVFTKDLPEKLAKNDRLLVYFAGHGVAIDGDNGPAGFLIPEDACREDSSTFWPMTELHKALEELPCRHMLAILDCCFAGAFRWSSKRAFQPLPPVIYKEHYERFIRSSAWQVITSAAYDQTALDILSGRVLSEQEDRQQQKRQHSPFAQALFDALAGAADTTPKDGDGVITATELYLYLRDEVEIPAEKLADHRQSPGLWPLNKHEHGEFIFLMPEYGELNLPPAPDLTKENNPYKGLSSYEKGDSKLFFGRTALIEKLKKQVEKQPFTVVLGASGTGKSSLVKAGLLPALEKETEDGDASQASSWFILEKEVERDGKKKKRVMRPGTNPAANLRSLLIKALPGVRPEREKGSTPSGLVGQWRKKNPRQKLLLVIDQFEELITLCREEQTREDFIRELMQVLEEHSDVLRIVLTLRSDFEAQISQNYLKDWWQQDSRFVVPPMTQDELREVIEQPASVMVLYFEPHELIDDLINEVIQTPGALPLLSFTLSELYLRYVERQKDVERQDGNRALTEADYKEIGGVIGSLRRRIDQEYEKLDAAHQATMKRILLRMIAFEGGELTRRRVPNWELDYPDVAENERRNKVVDILFQARLIVTGSSDNAGGKTESYIEPAHDALIVAWDKLLKWRADEEEAMLLQRQLTRAAADWEGSADKKEKKGLLWDNNPRLVRAQEILQEKRIDRRMYEEKQGLFVWLKQFCRVLFPSFEDIEQTVWLNRVETAFVRRSVERKRNWTWGVTVFISAVIVALATAGGITWIKKLEADRERENAVVKEKEARYQLSINYWNNGISERTKENGSSLKALHYFALSAENFARSTNVDLSINSLLAQKIIQGRVKLHAVIEHETRTDGLQHRDTRGVFNNDGSKFLTWIGKHTLLVAPEISSARIWDSATGVPLSPVLKHGDDIIGARFNKDEGKILTWSSDNTAKLWNSNSENDPILLTHKGKVLYAIFNNDESKIFTWGRNDAFRNAVHVWDANTGKENSPSLECNNIILDITSVIDLRLSDDEKMILAFDKSNTRSCVWDISRRKLLNTPLIYKEKFRGVMFSDDGSKVILQEKQKYSPPIFSDSMKELLQLENGYSIEGKFSNDRTSKIITWSHSGVARNWNIDAEKLYNSTIDLLQDNKNNQAIFNRNSKQILTWNTDGIINIFDTNTNNYTTQGVQLKHNDRFIGITINNSGNKIVAWYKDGAGRIFDSATGNLLLTIHNEIEQLKKMTINAEIEIGGAVFSGDESKVLIWGTLIEMIEIPSTPYSDGGEQEASPKSIFCILDSNTSRPVIKLVTIENEYKIDGAILNNDGSSVLIWNNNMVRRLDSRTGSPTGPILQKKSISGAMFNNDESRLITWDSNKVRIWDNNSGTPVTPELKIGNKKIRDVAINEKEGTVFILNDDYVVNSLDISVDTEWPSDNIVLKTEIETGTEMTASGDVQILPAASWQEKKWCEYDKIQYQLNRISREQWNMSQRACKQLKQGKVKTSR